ncbi:MAG TPA: VOC family protein [Aurantimonas sp.]
MRAGVDWPGGEAGSVVLVDFILAGQSFQALNGGPREPFNDAISLSVSCEDQAEVDHYWAALSADGRAPVQSGWLRDKFGLSWQIVPEVLPRMLRDEDEYKDKARRVMEAMMQMVKLDVAALQEAYDGR